MSQELATLKSDLAALNAKVAAFEARRARTIAVPAFEVELREGESYAGLVLNKDGTPRDQLILMPDEFTGNWDAAVKWAAKAGGELPTRQEQSLLYANCKEQFQPQWYWSGEQRGSSPGYAWLQTFDGGDQYLARKSNSSRARAVRRSPVL